MAAQGFALGGDGSPTIAKHQLVHEKPERIPARRDWPIGKTRFAVRS
jgi:hypothetical protein